MKTEKRNDTGIMCATHTHTRLVCPKCLAAKGGTARADKHGSKQLSEWGKLGGRPKKSA